MILLYMKPASNPIFIIWAHTAANNMMMLLPPVKVQQNLPIIWITANN